MLQLLGHGALVVIKLPVRVVYRVLGVFLHVHRVVVLLLRVRIG